MNRVVFRLLVDYLRRTLGVWVIVWFLHTMQASTFFAGGKLRVPMVGAIVAALAFFAMFNSPQSVMRTLPIDRRDLALTRWWAAVGWPIVLSAFCIFGGWWANGSWDFPRPELASLGVLMLICASAPGALSVLPMPSLSPGRRENLGLFVVVWGVLVVVSLRGVPLTTFSSAGWVVVIACGFVLGLMSFVRAMKGDAFTVSLPFVEALARKLRSQSGATSSSSLRGWSVVGAQLLKATMLLTVAGIVGITALRFSLPELDAAKVYQTAMATGYVAVIGVAASVLVRRWLNAIRVIQMLPVRDSSLALMICLTLTMPPLIACLATSALHAMFPMWGIPIPAFIYPIFAIVPALFVPMQSAAGGSGIAAVVQQWSPIFQIAIWPLWSSAFASLVFTALMPAWFVAAAMGAGIIFAVGGYLLVYARIRSGAGLEHKAGPLATR